MDFELFGIFAFILIAAWLLFSFVTATHRRANEHEERKLELEARAAEARNGQGGEAYRQLE